MQALFAKIRTPSLRYGLLFGLILGGAQLVLGLIATFITDMNVISVLSTIGLALFIILGFNAGQRAAQEAGKWAGGALAGIWTGLVGAILAAVVPFVQTVINLQAVVELDRSYIKAHPADFPGVNTTNFGGGDALKEFLIALLPSIAFYILIALLGSSLGAVLRRKRAPVTQPQEPTQEA